MKNFYKLSLLFLSIAALCFSLGQMVLAQDSPQVQTVSATNIQGSSVLLNGELNYMGGSTVVYFQWGTDTNYGNQTPAVMQNFIGIFSQSVSNLASNIAYHFRAVAQNNYGTVYGQDMVFVTGQYNNGGIINSIQTNAATYISNFQATLNATLSSSNYSGVNYIYFQWGTTNAYGSQTPQQPLSYSGAFFQNIANLNAGTTYHFRAVAQGNLGFVYGQDMTFTTSGGSNSSNGIYSNGLLTVSKQAIDLSTGNTTWQTIVNANPSDLISFAITLQAGGQDIHNVVVRDILPATLVYKGKVTVNTNSNYSGDITSGINIGTVSAGQTVIVAYQAQVVPAVNLNFGINTLSNSASVTSSEAGAQTATALVMVNKSTVYGASTEAGPTSVSTGLTNNFWADSFLLPLLLIVFGAWLYFSGNIYKFADWLKTKI